MIYYFCQTNGIRTIRGIIDTLFGDALFIEFDKMQIPYRECTLSVFGLFGDNRNFAFLCADFGWRTFYFSGKRRKIPERSPTMPSKEKHAALSSALNHLHETSFSKKSLKDVLIREGYPIRETEYALKHCGADWKEQAVRSSLILLHFSVFSKEELTLRLSSDGYARQD